MMRIGLFLPLLLAYAHSNAQCTHQTDPPTMAHKAAAFADDDAVWDIPIVVHVLYGSEADSIPADVIRAMFLDSVNADFRRTNWDTIYTQTVYRPISVDTRILFRFASTDPEGNPTDGITYRQTDGQTFNWMESEMMFDSLGGREPWDVCSYINIYVCRHQGGQQYVDNTNPWNESGRIGLVADPFVFLPNPNYRIGRHLTHFLAHYLGLREYGYTSQCVDVDGLEDTPIQLGPPIINLLTPDSIYVETHCDPTPEGRLGCNFMMPTQPHLLHRMNMFTQRQKEYMRELTAFYHPGLIDASACWPAAMEETDDEAALLLHPNPTNSILRFNANASSPYTVTDMMGRMVQQGHVQAGQNELQVAALPDGIYLIRLEGAGSASRFVKVSQ